MVIDKGQGEAAKQRKAQGQNDAKGRIADPGDDKGLAARSGVGRIGVPETDEGIGAKPYGLPSQVKEEQIYGVVLSALYIPIGLMLLGLIFRGVSFEFREEAHYKAFWNLAFGGGSLLAAVAQGFVLGAC